jgi:nucleoside-diphosphate-sugar epimerase
MIDQVAPDYIIHCAAHVPKALKAYQDSSGADASQRMLETILAGSDCPIVFISSMTVYGAERARPTVELDAGDPISAYGRGKWQAEMRLKADGRSALAVRIPGLFGPARRGGLVYNVMKTLQHGHSRPQLPEAAILWAAMHVEDAAESIVKLVSSPIIGFDAIHVGYRGVYSIGGFISLACDIYDRRIDYVVRQPRFEFDLARAENRGAVPASSFRDALVKFGEQQL